MFYADAYEHLPIYAVRTIAFSTADFFELLGGLGKQQKSKGKLHDMLLRNSGTEAGEIDGSSVVVQDMRHVC